MSKPSLNRRQEQARLEDLYQGIYPYLLQTERVLQDVASRGQGMIPEIIRYVVQAGGKRLRPALVVLSAQMGGTQSEDVITVGAACELIHLSTLVHDDMVDHAVLRHGKPTAAVQFGDEVAILLGDYLYVEGFTLLASINDPVLLDLFARSTRSICHGEINQVRRRFQLDLSLSEYLSFIDHKTATLMNAAMRGGARLARLSTDQTTALGHYGWNIGMAFQIIDDTLDLIGEEEVTGKTLRTDLTNGKLTLPLIYLRDRLSPADREQFLSYFKNPDTEAVSRLIGWLKDSGAIREGLRQASGFAHQAKSALQSFPNSSPKTTLQSIADYIVTRIR
ncbi:MAG: polyprenyl synthetase family protein [Elusimicrobiota bacterium]